MWNLVGCFQQARLVFLDLLVQLPSIILFLGWFIVFLYEVIPE